MTLSMLRQPPKPLGAGLLGSVAQRIKLETDSISVGSSWTCLSSRTIITGTEQA